ncbi:MAG: IPT/TIG domain-containing protein [Myxococcaceae bacterium]
MNRSLTRWSRCLLVAALTLSAAALAQPANDACATAEVIPTTSFPVNSSVVNLTGATFATDVAFSCQASSNSSVWYSFTPTTTAIYTIHNCAGVAGNTLSDTVLMVFTGTCAAPVAVASGCNDDGCSTKSSVTLTLTAGTPYLIEVGKFGTTAPGATDTMQIQIQQTVAPANDTCGGTVPALQANRPLAGSINAASANDSVIGGGAACFTGLASSHSSNAATGGDSVFSFTPPSTGNWSVRLTPTTGSASINTVAYVTDSCTAAAVPPQTYSPPQCLAASNRAGSTSTSAEEVACVPMTQGVPVYVWADSTAAVTATATFEVEVSQCFPETEPNDTPATANALSCPMTGRISPTNEADFFALGTPTLPARVFALVDGNASGNAGSSVTDFDLRVTTATDTLEYDDTNADTPWGGSSATVAGTPLQATTNFLRVSYFSTTTATEPYRLYSVVQSGTAQAEAEPNDTIANANYGAANYFSGDVSSTADTDLYAFDATAGDLIFLGLDSLPARTGTTATANLNVALLDSAGAVIIAEADSATSVTTTVATGSLTSTTPTVPGDSLVYRARTSGVYYARVTRVSTTGMSTYLLSVSKNCLPGGGFAAPTITSVTPNTGSILGGTSVVIAGTNFASVATVTIGGAAATVTARSATSLTVTTPPGVAGPVDVVVTNTPTLTTTLTGGFTYFAPVLPPTVTSVTPNQGSTLGGTNVTIVGTLFKPGAEVYFTVGAARVAATNVTVVSALQLTCTTPAQAAGQATVTVRNPVDALEGGLVNGFTFNPPPTVTSVSPNTGLTTGGGTITVNGTGFLPGATVKFGAASGTSVVVDPSGTFLTVTLPVSGVNGAVDVVVTNTDTQQATLTGGFTYSFPPPTVTSVSPAVGFTPGGQTLTINGTNFTTGATVTVGGTAATGVVRVSATRLTAITPAHAVGAVDVVVTNSDSQTATLTNGFTYVAPPTVTSLTPNSGLYTGGTTVTVNGTNFQPGAVVRFGTAVGTGVVVDASGTFLTVVTPSVAVAGVVDVTVVNDNQTAVLTQAFTYLYPVPTVTNIVPNTGYASGGTAITINGGNFFTGATVSIGGTAATSVVRVSATRITCTTPAGMAGPADVRITNTDAQFVNVVGGFTYIPSPTLTAVAPNHGPKQGGTLVSLTGTNFLTGATVAFGGVPAFAVNVTSPTTATAVTNGATPGTVDVKLTNPDGQSVTLPMAFTFDPGPTLMAASPITGPIAGGTAVTLTGSGFLAGAQVLFGTDAATNVTVTNATTLTATSPAHAVGVVSLTVRNSDGQFAELPRAFRFVQPPAVSSLTPDTGDVAGGTLVHLTGNGFNAGSSVTFGGSAATQVSFVSPTELVATTPVHAPGAVDVVVTVDGASATLAGAFTYTRGAPTLAAVAPLRGPTTGGTTLSLTGTNFATGATVKVGGVAATDVVVVSPVLVRVVAPAHAAGLVDIELTNDDLQTATLPMAFTYATEPTGNGGTVVDGGSGSLGTEPMGGGGGEGGVSCGCSSFDGPTFSLAGLMLVSLLARRRRSSR